MSRIEEVNKLEDLRRLRLVWRMLLDGTREANYFQSLDWLETYLAHYGTDQLLRVLVVHSCESVIGILPLVVRTDKTGIGPVRRLTYPLDHWGTFYGPIGPNPTATLVAAMGHLQRSGTNADIIDLPWVNREGTDFGRTPRAMEVAGYRVQRRDEDEIAVVEFDRSWSDYWNARPAQWQQNRRREERLLAREGPLRYERYRPLGAAHGDCDPRWDLYDDCVRVAQSRQQGSSKTDTTMSHTGVSDYLRDAHQQAARAGGLDVNVLYVADVPAAFAYNYQWQGLVSGLRMGFDPTLARAGVGSVLVRRMIEDGFRRGDTQLDLGTNSAAWKASWLTSVRRTQRCSHYPAAGLRAQAVRFRRIAGAWRAASKGRRGAATSKESAA